MKRKSKQDVLKNLTLFLKELHSTLPAFLSLADLLAKYQLDAAYGTILLRDHYIIKTGNRENMKYEYRWNVGESD